MARLPREDSRTAIPQLEKMINALHPIGSIMITTEPTPPTYFKWERFAVGKTLVGVDAEDEDFERSGNTGGEKKHTLTIAEMPSHNHSRSTSPHSWAERATGNGIISPSSGTSNPVTKYSNNTGGGGSHNNMPPYITVYMWKRIA